MCKRIAFVAFQFPQSIMETGYRSLLQLISNAFIIQENELHRFKVLVIIGPISTQRFKTAALKTYSEVKL